jgi:hypothetical protein
VRKTAVSAKPKSDLARALWAVADSDVIKGNFAIVEAFHAPHYYIQFRGIAGVLRCEAVHNSYLPREHQLSPVQAQRLIDLGWRPPKETPGNFVRSFIPQSPAECEDIARLVCRTFNEVFDVEPEGVLRLAMPSRTPIRRRGLRARRD